MAVRIEVVQGADAGWSYVVQAREVRIGRGGGCHIRMRDPGWPDGNLHLVNKQGGWLVVNRMPTGIFLDSQVLESGQQATWYEGGLLQPTANTLLRLVSHEGLVTGSQPVVILPPGTAKKHTQIWQYLFIAGCVAVSVFLVMQPNRAAMVPRSTAGLPTVLESQAKDPILGPPIAQVRRLMDDSSLFVKQNKVPEAFRCLDQARALLERMAAEDAPNRLRGDDLTAFRAELKKLGASVGAQLVLLHRKLPKK
jgi:hypothetical protein